MGEHINHISDEAVFEVLKWVLLGLVAVLAPFLKKNGVKRTFVRGGWSAFLLLLCVWQLASAYSYHRQSGFNNGAFFAITLFGTFMYGFYFFLFNSNWIYATVRKVSEWWADIRDMASPDYTPKAVLTAGDTQPVARMIAQLEEVDYRSEGLFKVTRQLNQAGAEAVEPLIGALSHARANVRQNAAFVLGQIKDSRAIPPLIETFNDTSMRLVAALALAEFGRPVIEPLAAAARGTNRQVRDGAITALGWCQDSRSVEELDKLFDEWLDKRQSEGQELIETSVKLLDEYRIFPIKDMPLAEWKELMEGRIEAISQLRRQSVDYHDLQKWWLGRDVARALSSVATAAIKYRSK